MNFFHSFCQCYSVPAPTSQQHAIRIRWVEAPRSKGLALVCIAPRDKIAVIVVRGTENARNVVQALKVWPRYRPEGAEFGVGVHAGYAEVADELYEALHQEMHGLIAKDTAIHVTGHSMGGAVSLILAMRLVAAGYLVSQVVTFAAPMVIWSRHTPAFAALGDARLPVIRVEHALDPVPCLPAPTRALAHLSHDKLWRYQPVGRLVTIGTHGARQMTKRNSILQMSKAHRLGKYREGLLETPHHHHPRQHLPHNLPEA